MKFALHMYRHRCCPNVAPGWENFQLFFWGPEREAENSRDRPSFRGVHNHQPTAVISLRWADGFSDTYIYGPWPADRMD